MLRDGIMIVIAAIVAILIVWVADLQQRVDEMPFPPAGISGALR